MERKRMGREPMDAERERDLFFDLSLNLLATINFDGYFTRLNPAWEQTLGFTHDELMARPFIDFVHPDDQARTIVGAQKVSAGKMVTNFENRYVCKDGSYRWLLWSVRPYLERNLMYASAHDITERKLSEAALRESEQKFSAIFNQTFGLLGLLDAGGILLDVNQTALDAIQAQLSDVIGQKFWDTPWWNHSLQAESLVKGAIERGAKGEFSRFQMQLPASIGPEVDIDFSLKPIFDEEGRVVLMIAEGRDITDLKHTERTSAENQRKFSAIFEQSFELMGIVSLDGVLLDVNQTALDSIEARKEDIVGRLFWETPWWHTSQLQQQLKEAIKQSSKGKFCRYEVQFPHPSGVMLTTDFSLKPIFDESGCVELIVAEARDITEQNKIQSKLEERNQELDSFVHIVSHDLKAPLRAISNLSQWIEEDLAESLTADNQAKMQLLRTRVHKMNAMIDGLLDYARIGRTDRLIEPVVVSELLAETIRTLTPPPNFTISLAQPLPTLCTNRIFLAQVFANLIGNAIKHHDREDGAIHIKIAERSDCYEFSIADDGPGIDPVYHERVFGIFQAINPQNRSDSSGVGLAIVKKIVEAEGGTLRLESQLCQGTTFFFTWPKQRE
jgi:PAS domain S-box-containing protein